MVGVWLIDLDDSAAEDGDGAVVRDLHVSTSTMFTPSRSPSGVLLKAGASSVSGSEPERKVECGCGI